MEDQIVFRWHYPRGTLSKKMSGLELATFVLSRMPAVVPLISDMPVIQRAFVSLLQRLAAMSPSVLDELHAWFKPVVGTEDMDIIEMRPVLPDEALSLYELEQARKGVYV